ncbi:MAG: hypothetical protein AB2L24_02480 [Mangrovibacterium sp.]
MTSDTEKIYAINYRDTLWSCTPGLNGISWKEIGRNNALTYNIRTKQIAVLNERLYAVSEDDKLYVNEHSSDKTLSANALAIKNRDKTVVIVGVDLVTFDDSLIRDIKTEIYKRRNIPPAAILINASHTHYAPVSQNWSTWEDFYHYPDSNYIDFLKKRIIESIELSLDNLVPSDIFFGRGSTNIGLNRRG